jgi:hypothetical protein
LDKGIHLVARQKGWGEERRGRERDKSIFVEE